MNAVDIANLALSNLGDSATVASIDPPEGSAQAQHCARFYPLALAVMLETHHWNFATTRVVLAELKSISPRGDWRYAYALPSNAAEIISVMPRQAYDGIACDCIRPELAHRWPYAERFELMCWGNYRIMVLNDQRVILSNSRDAIAVYTLSTPHQGMSSAMFNDALSWKLASMLAGPLIKGDAGMKMAQNCLSAYMKLMGQATMQDANQQRSSPQHTPTWMAVRGVNTLG